MKTIFNNCLIKAEFPNKLKLADVTQILTKEDPSRAKNYRPVSVLPSDTINHDLLIAKLDAYGFDIASLKLIRSCLTNRFQ